MAEMTYVFRTDNDEKKWLWEEMQAGRLRQGWGVLGMTLVEDGTPVPKDQWVSSYSKVAPWPGEFDPEYAGKRYSILSVMREIRTGDLLVVPKMPDWQTFTIASAAGTYDFDVSEDTPRDDYRHVVPVDVDSICQVPYRSSLEARVIRNKFGAYRSALNRVYNKDMKNAVATLAEGSGQIPDAMDIGDIYSDLESRALDNIRDHLTRMPWDDLERIVERVFVSAGYALEATHVYDREGGDADLVFTRDWPLLADMSTKLFVQVKNKSGEDSDDVAGVRQLVKITEPEVNALRVLITTADEVSRECRELAEASDVAILAGTNALRFIFKNFNT